MTPSEHNSNPWKQRLMAVGMLIAIPLCVVLTLVVLRAVTTQNDFLLGQVEFGYRDNGWVNATEVPADLTLDDMEMRFTVTNNTSELQRPATGWRPWTWDRDRARPLAPRRFNIESGRQVVRYIPVRDVLCGFIESPTPPVLIYAQVAVGEPFNSKFGTIPDEFVEAVQDADDCPSDSVRNR